MSEQPLAATSPGVELYWIPLGSGAHVVRISGGAYEAIAARVHRRARCDLYHSALVVGTNEGSFVIEMTSIADGRGWQDRGVVAEAHDLALRGAADEEAARWRVVGDALRNQLAILELEGGGRVVQARQLRLHARAHLLEPGVVPHLVESERARGKESVAQLRRFLQRGDRSARIPQLGLEARQEEIERGVAGPLAQRRLDGGDGAPCVLAILLGERGKGDGDQKQKEGGAHGRIIAQGHRRFAAERLPNYRGCVLSPAGRVSLWSRPPMR